MSVVDSVHDAIYLYACACVHSHIHVPLSNMSPTHSPLSPTHLFPSPHSPTQPHTTLPQALLGNEYTLYLLETREAKPVVVVIPTDAVLPPAPILPPLALSGLFGLATVVTSLSCNGFPLLSFDEGAPPLTGELLGAALPGTAAFLGLLGMCGV